MSMRARPTQRDRLTRDSLYKAARAGALCVVIRSKDWRPAVGDRIKGIQIKHLDEPTADGAVTTVEKSPSPLEPCFKSS
jgi:hypothetical protein